MPGIGWVRHEIGFENVFYKRKTPLRGKTNSRIISDNRAGVSRRQHKMSQNVQKIQKILEFCNYIWNHHEKCIKKSTNTPDIGLESCDILKI